MAMQIINLPHASIGIDFVFNLLSLSFSILLVENLLSLLLLLLSLFHTVFDNATVIVVNATPATIFPTIPIK